MGWSVAERFGKRLGVRGENKKRKKGVKSVITSQAIAMGLHLPTESDLL